MRRSLSLVLLGLLAASVAGQPAGFPKTAPPAFQMALQLDAGKGVVRFLQTELVTVPEKVAVTEIVGGKERIVEKIVTRTVTVSKEVEQKLTSFDILTGDGKKLTPEEAAPLVKNRLVLVTVDVGGLDPLYRKLLAKDALVFVRKADK